MECMLQSKTVYSVYMMNAVIIEVTNNALKKSTELKLEMTVKAEKNHNG